MFRSIFLKTLRDYRIGILGWGIGMGLLLTLTMVSVAQLTASPQARAELIGLAGQFAWSADPVAVDTPGGYAMFKLGVFVFIIAVWPLLAASRALRGEEERGSMDILLSQPRSRARVALEKTAAIWTALLAMGVLIGITAYAGGEKTGGDFGFAGAMLYGVDVALVCMVFAGLVLLLSQYTSEAGPAAGWGGGLLVIFVTLDMVHRVFPDLEWVSRLSPIYYFNLSKPLVPSYGTNAGAMAFLFVLSLVLAAAAIAIFVRRDIGATVALPRFLRAPRRAPRAAVLPVRDWSVRSVYSRSIAMLLVPTIWWAALFAGFTAWTIVAVNQIGHSLEDLLKASPELQQFYMALGASAGTSIDALFLSAMFQTLPVLLMAFVVTQVNGWASDEENGRLDMVLATPQPRVAVILGRFAALSTAAVGIGLITLAVTIATARSTGVSLDEGNVVAATLAMVPLGLLIGGIGYLGAGWLRTAVDTGLLSLLLAFWFFLGLLGRDLGWSEDVLKVTPFYYYGNPLLNGIAIANVIGLLAVAGVALAIGAYRFARKDIAV